MQFVGCVTNCRVVQLLRTRVVEVSRRRHVRALLCVAVLVVPVPVACADASALGISPIQLSYGSAPANSGSMDPSISGDNRKGRIVAFTSEATNLAGGDNNASQDIYLWQRRHGPPRQSWGRSGQGSITRISRTPSGGAPNGDSYAPAVDGAIAVLDRDSAPSCVVYASTATNISLQDQSPDADIYRYELRSGKTTLISRTAFGDAGSPLVSGDCTQIVWQDKAGVVRWQNGREKRYPGATSPDLSGDGRAFAFERAGTVYYVRDSGPALAVSSGSNPKVTYGQRLHGQRAARFGIAFDSDEQLLGLDHNDGSDVYFAHYAGSKRHRTKLELASRITPKRSAVENHVAGVSAYAQHKGNVVFTIDTGGLTQLVYYSRRFGFFDSLAFATAPTGESGIQNVSVSPRNNYITWDSPGGTAHQSISTKAIRQLVHDSTASGPRPLPGAFGKPKPANKPRQVYGKFTICAPPIAGGNRPCRY